MAGDKRTYWDKLKDPRWQKKRLEILNRDEFRCVICGDDESTLNVHHGFYRKDLEPWEYPSESLHTLCETCHGQIKSEMQAVYEKLGALPPEWIFDVQRLLTEFCRAWPFFYVTEDYARWRRERGLDSTDG